MIVIIILIKYTCRQIKSTEYNLASIPLKPITCYLLPNTYYLNILGGGKPDPYELRITYYLILSCRGKPDPDKLPITFYLIPIT